MKTALIIMLTLFECLQCLSQDFDHDNKLYKTVSWQEFLFRLEQNPKMVYFDIRTPGERSDTSQYKSYNQGKISGAIETDYFDFDKFYPEYLKHKSDSIYIYCSHSRRSRLLAKRLVDSSFKNVFNINGGLSYLNTIPEGTISLKNKYFTSNLKYQLVTPYFFIENLKNPEFQYVDVRSDSVYLGISGEERLIIFGNIESVLHIPYDKISENFDLFDKEKKIVLFDNYGEESPEAANLLTEKGFECNVLSFGLDNLIGSIPQKERSFLKTKYELLLPSELLKITEDTNSIIIDVRTESEFTSNDTAEWKNTGRIKNAVNIPLSGLTKDKIEKYKDKKIVLYDIMMHDELFEFANKMNEYGIKNFCLLFGGIFQIKWEIYNEGKTEFMDLIINK